MKIMFLIRSLDVGGAERQLVSLARGLQETGHEVTVAVFYPEGKLESDLDGSDVKIHSLGKKGRWDIFGFIYRVIRLVRSQQIDIFHSYLPGANIIAVLAKPLLGNTPVVLAVAASNMDMSCYDRTARFTYWLEAKLTRYSDLIISNSKSSVTCAVQRGFPDDKMIVLPNPHDVEKFQYDTEARHRVRREWGVKDTDILIGTVARFDAMKDHKNFINAASKLSNKRTGIRFVCVGDGEESYTSGLKELTVELGVDELFIWPGPRQDMPNVYSALDINTCSSAFGEGLPNAIGEAMSCNTPCVVTDVGDCARIVGDTGEVVMPGSAQALADGWLKMIGRLNKDAPGVGGKARERIVNK
ncbi:MAG: glycosyltransferase, partial [Gammaproteobacteria bacterium]|nr:glycosyltransferase [Gammaproteobacteria bacterium]